MLCKSASLGRQRLIPTQHDRRGLRQQLVSHWLIDLISNPRIDHLPAAALRRIYLSLCFGLALKRCGYRAETRIKRVIRTNRQCFYISFATVFCAPSRLKSKRKQNKCWWIGELIIGATIGDVSVPSPSGTTDTPICPVSFTSIWIVPSW